MLRRCRKQIGQNEPRLLGLRSWSDELLGRGFFNEVRVLNPDSVVKIARPYGPLRQPLSWLVRNRVEHEAAAKYLPVPRTYHLRMRTLEGPAVNVMLQQYIPGRVLSEISDAELQKPRLRENLRTTMTALHRCARQLGWVPDIIGGPPRWGIHDLRRSNNLFVDSQDQVWLIDPGALFLWFSRRNPIGWIYTGLLLRSARRLARKKG